MFQRSRSLFIVLFVALLVIAGVVVAAATGAKGLAPLRLTAQYPWNVLADEADTMSECAECHEAPDMHTCTTCHDEHGDAKLPEVPFASLVLLTGDVPDPQYIAVNEIVPYYQEPHAFVLLLDFLADHGVTDFESVTLATSDGGFVTLEQQYVTTEALLLPYVDGIRFAAENLHVSTWMKGINRIIVVGQERPLRIDGQETSIGRLLLGPTRSVTVEQTEVMLKSETDGEIRKGRTASRVEGAPLNEILSEADYNTLLVRDAGGREFTLTAKEAHGAVLAVLFGRTTLVLPERGRAQWVENVVEISAAR
jgi:hypothetical protein